MVPVAGQPFVQRQLALLADQGFDRVVLCIGHLGSQVRHFVGDGSRWGLVVEYADEGEDLRGTGGALRIAFDAGLLDDRFAILYGDSYLPLAVPPVWEAAVRDPRPALMTVYRDPEGLEVPNAEYQDGTVILYRKGEPTARMRHVDYGLSVLKRAVVDVYVSAGVSVDLAHVFQELSTRDLLAGFEVDERFYEIGSPAGLADLEVYLADPIHTPTLDRPPTPD
jgi:NDP-sugar pyrophosphorylase family protein